MWKRSLIDANLEDQVGVYIQKLYVTIKYKHCEKINAIARFIASGLLEYSSLYLL